VDNVVFSACASYSPEMIACSISAPEKTKGNSVLPHFAHRTDGIGLLLI
jgi:hypothetical protein